MSARGWFAVRVVLMLVVVAGLAVDVYVHLDLASSYNGVRSNTLSQATLFRVEGAIAALAALALIVRPRRYTVLFAFLVAAGGLAAVLIYRYVDVGAVGPFPNMYEPLWYSKKTQSAWAEGIAAVAAGALFVLFQARLHMDRAAGHRRSAASQPGAPGH